MLCQRAVTTHFPLPPFASLVSVVFLTVAGFVSLSPRTVGPLLGVDYLVLFWGVLYILSQAEGAMFLLLILTLRARWNKVCLRLTVLITKLVV